MTLDVPPTNNEPYIPPQAAVADPIPFIPPVIPPTPSHKRPVRTPGCLVTSASYLVPDHIRKKFIDGWNVHVPLTFLTDKGCLLKDKSSTNFTQDMLTIDNGCITTTSKPLFDDGELDLTFDEWFQAWRRLLDLIKLYIPEEFPLWETHFSSILNNDNRAELWPIHLAYDVEMRKKATQVSVDPSQFSIGLWNDLESRYNAKKAISYIQADLKSSSGPSHTPRDPPRPNNRSSFRNNSQQLDKSSRCFICGDRSREHSSRNCPASCNTSGQPCHLSKHVPSGKRQSKSGKPYCFAWNGISGCSQNPCSRGEHWCTLCGSKSHNAQQCAVVA